MDSWDDEVEENHVVVRYKETHSILVKVTSHTTVSQILQKVCDKWNLNPENHLLKYHTEELVDSGRNVGTSIPPNSTLHLVEAQVERDLQLDDEDIIFVSYQTGSTVFRKPFQKSDTLTKVMNEFCEASPDLVRKQAGKDTQAEQNQVGSQTTPCKLKLESNEKLVVLLPSGAVTLDQSELDTTTLSHFNHRGHLYLAFMVDDLEDVPLLEDDQYDVLQSSQDESSQFFNLDRQERSPTESEPSMDKVKQLVQDGLIEKSKSRQSIASNQEPLPLSELFDRYGLIYRLDEGDTSSSDLVLKKTLEEKSGVFTISWISICFEDKLALQASFSPLEYVQDVKTYVKKFLVNPNSEFDLTFKGKALDENDSIFSCGLAPSSKITFAPKYAEDEEVDNQTQARCSMHLLNNGLDSKFSQKIVTQSIAAATAINLSQVKPEITVKSEMYRPKSEETTWEKVKIPKK